MSHASPQQFAKACYSARMSGTTTQALTGGASGQAQAVLAQVQASLRSILTSSSRVLPGQAITAAVVPLSPIIDVSDLANGVIDVALGAKDVVFKDASVLPVPLQGNLGGTSVATALASTSGGEPFPPPVGPTLPVLNPLGTPVTTNVTGTLSQLFGTFALPSLKIGATIDWTVRRQIDPTDPSKGAQTLAEGQDFVATSGLASPSISLVLPPTFVEMRLDTLTDPQLDRACLIATVTLSLAGETLKFSLPPLEILLLPLPIPTIVALFDQGNFNVSYGGSVLIMVPARSALSSAKALFTTLQRIEGVIDAIRGIAGIAGWLLGLDELIGALPDQTRIRFIAGDQVPKLSAVQIQPGPLWGLLPGRTFDDATRSLFVFGVPGTTVKFFNDVNFKTDQGHYTVTLQLSPFVAIRELADYFGNQDSRTVAPLTLPPNAITDWSPDNGDDDHDWQYSLSSVQFTSFPPSNKSIHPLGDCATLRSPPVVKGTIGNPRPLE